MRIVNCTRGTLLSSRSRIAEGWWERLQAHRLGWSRSDLGTGVLLVSCNAVNTYRMAVGVDVIFVDATGSVLALRSEMKPGTWSGKVEGARYALKVPEGTIRLSGTRVGDVLQWTPSRTPAVGTEESG